MKKSGTRSAKHKGLLVSLLVMATLVMTLSGTITGITSKTNNAASIHTITSASEEVSKVPMALGPHLEWKYATGRAIRSSAFVADVDGDGRQEVVVGSDDAKIYCLNSTGGLEWSYKTGNRVSSSPIVADVDEDGKQEVIFGSDDFTIYCLNSTGGLKWTYVTGNWVESSPAITDIDGDGDKEVVVGSDDGKIYCLNSTGGLKWAYTASDHVVSSPIVTDINKDGQLDVVVGSSDHNVYCLSNAGGLEWNFATGGSVTSSAAVKDITGDGLQEVIIGSDDGRIYCLNATGKEMWSYLTGSAVESTCAIADIDSNGQQEVIAASGINIWCFNRTGKFNWRYPTGGTIRSSPVVVDIDVDGQQEIVVGSSDYKIYYIRGTGSQRWNYTTQGGVFSSPAVADIDADNQTEIIVGSDDSNLYCLDIAPVPLPTGELIIRVVKSYKQSEGVRGATVYSVSQPEYQTPLSGVTDIDGFADFGSVAAGSYTVRVNGSGFSIFSNYIYVYAGQRNEYWLSPDQVYAFDPVVVSLFVAFVIIAIVAMAGAYESFHKRELASGLNGTHHDGDRLTELHEHLVSKHMSDTCPYCGVGLAGLNATFCWNCGASQEVPSEIAATSSEKKTVVKTIGKCMVCNLEVETDDVTLWCPYCGNVAHKSHLLEWLHVKNCCPSCQRHLDEKNLKDQPAKRRSKKHPSSRRQA